jgi:hypothetical protein
MEDNFWRLAAAILASKAIALEYLKSQSLAYLFSALFTHISKQKAAFTWFLAPGGPDMLGIGPRTM